MKTATATAEAPAPIVRLLDPSTVASVGDDVVRARAFAAPLVIEYELPTGEGVLAHADGVATILAAIGTGCRRSAPRRPSSPTPPTSSASPMRC